MSGHILKSFDRDLDEVTKLVYTMGTTVSSQLEKAGKALIKLDVALAEQVRDGDAIVNGQHVEVDAKVENQIAIRQPQAVDLRRLLGCSRISIDLERMGDEVRNIAPCRSPRRERPYQSFGARDGCGDPAPHD